MHIEWCHCSKTSGDVAFKKNSSFIAKLCPRDKENGQETAQGGPGWGGVSAAARPAPLARHFSAFFSRSQTTTIEEARGGRLRKRRESTKTREIRTVWIHPRCSYIDKKSRKVAGKTGKTGSARRCGCALALAAVAVADALTTPGEGTAVSLNEPDRTSFSSAFCLESDG